MWIEEMFGDMKKHGFDLEASHLRHFLRLSRLTLAVCLLYLWLVAMAEHVITSHQAHEVDRHDRRDLSLFRLGWDFVERRLALFDPIPPVAIPSFCLPSVRSRTCVQCPVANASVNGSPLEISKWAYN
jgi:hypothetical protein